MGEAAAEYQDGSQGCALLLFVFLEPLDHLLLLILLEDHNILCSLLPRLVSIILIVGEVELDLLNPVGFDTFVEEYHDHICVILLLQTADNLLDHSPDGVIPRHLGLSFL